MYRKFKRKFKNTFLPWTIVFLILFFIVILMSLHLCMPEMFAKSITYSDLRDISGHDAVKYTPDTIISQFYISETKEQAGYLVYDKDEEQYFAIYLTDTNLMEIFDKELAKSRNSENYVQNLPEIRGRVTTVFSLGIDSKYRKALYNYLYNRVMEKLESENTTLTLKEEKKLELELNNLEKYSNHRVIINQILSEREKFENIIVSVIDILFIGFIVILIYFIIPFKYCRFQNIKDKIRMQLLNEEELQYDFDIAKNIGRVYIGDKFTFLVSKRNADIHINEKLAWIFTLKKGSSYFLVTIDFDSNKNVTPISCRNKNKIIDLLKENCPNACIGYNANLENIALINIENVKNFDKSTLDPYYSPTFRSYRRFMN